MALSREWRYKDQTTFVKRQGNRTNKLNYIKAKDCEKGAGIDIRSKDTWPENKIQKKNNQNKTRCEMAIPL